MELIEVGVKFHNKVQKGFSQIEKNIYTSLVNFIPVVSIFDK